MMYSVLVGKKLSLQRLFGSRTEPWRSGADLTKTGQNSQMHTNTDTYRQIPINTYNTYHYLIIHTNIDSTYHTYQYIPCIQYKSYKSIHTNTCNMYNTYKCLPMQVSTLKYISIQQIQTNTIEIPNNTYNIYHYSPIPTNTDHYIPYIPIHTIRLIQVNTD